MDKATATAFVERIEAHRAQEDSIWDEMRGREDYEMHEDKSIKAIIDARKNASALLDEAAGDLGAFDLVDDGAGNFVPREEVNA